MSKETENFWRGDFGNDYHKRNVGLVESNMEMFRFIFDCNELAPKSVLEFGAGTGQNLIAIKRLLPGIETIGVEINEQALHTMQDGKWVNATINSSILGFKGVTADLVLTKGLLIHVAPVDLRKAYDALYLATRRYLLVCEYYCPTPREITYRGNDGKAWARDFAGEIMANYPDLKLVDYGFRYHGDKYPQDDITYFLMEKIGD
jgi:pseudaminic acid biosynthesis-associated methylase